LINTTTVELLMVFIILGIIAVAIRRTIVTPQQTGLFEFALISCGIFWAIGPLLAFYYGKWSFIEHYSLPKWSIHILFKGYLVVILFILGIWSAGRIAVYVTNRKKTPTGLNPRLQIAFFYSKFRSINIWAILVIAIFLWSIRIIVGVKYNIWMSGTSSAKNLSALPYHIIILRSLTYTLNMGYLVWAAACFWSDKRYLYKYSALAVLFMEFFWFFALGRRFVLIWIVFVFLGFIASERKIKLKNILFIILTIIIILNFLFPYFQTVRYRYNSKIRIGDHNAFQRFGQAAIDAFKADKKLFRELNTENMSTRPLFLRNFTCNLCLGLEEKKPMMGRAFLRSVEYIIPSAIMPSKTTYLQTEQYIQHHFGYPEVDEACTWAAVGCADFGIIGGFLYGLILGLWIIVIGSLCTFIITRFSVVGICLFGAMIACLFQVEQSPTLSFVLCRNIVILLIFAVIFRSFIRIFYCFKSSIN